MVILRAYYFGEEEPRWERAFYSVEKARETASFILRVRGEVSDGLRFTVSSGG